MNIIEMILPGKPSSTVFVRSYVIVISCFLFACSSCSKKPSPATTAFKVYSRDAAINFCVPSFGLINGNFVTLDQNNGEDTFYVGIYGSESNLISFKTYGLSNPREIQDGRPLKDGGFITVGNNTDKTQFFVTKFDADGNQLWDNTYNYTFRSSGIRCCVATDGNILLSYGNSNGGSLPAKGVMIAKVNINDGSLMMPPLKITGTPDSLLRMYVIGLHERSDGIYISGFYFFYSDGFNMGSLFCLKTLENGNTQWLNYEPLPPNSQALLGNPWIISYNIAENTSGPVVLAATNSTVFNNAPFEYLHGFFYNLFGAVSVFGYDPTTGVKTDSLTFGTSSSADQPFIHPTADGGYIVCATTNFFVNSFTAPTKIMLVKMDAKFNVQWQKTFNPAGSNYMVLGLIPLSDGYEIIGQSSSMTNFSPRVGTFLIKTDLEGDIAN